ncbi:MAG: TorF family putative porin [Helicobacteraceae bacterium]|nr:TorF family putative porin [Helicobacteraceae bacterium]
MIRFVLLLSIAANYLVAAGFSGGLEYKSDYIFRGVTQTDRRSALQARLRYGFSAGFYLGAFGSNVYDPKSDKADAIEYDFFGGYLGEAGDTWFEAGAIGRNFSIDDANYIEALFAVGYGVFSLAYYDAVSAEDANHENDRYIEAAARFEEAWDLINIGFGAGYGLPNDRTADSPLNLFLSIDKTFWRKLRVGASAELYSPDSKEFDKARYAFFARYAL